MQDEPRDLDIRLTQIEDEIRSLRKEVRQMEQSRYAVPSGTLCALCLVCLVYSIPVSICHLCMVQGSGQQGTQAQTICAVGTICAPGGSPQGDETQE
jgi:hypothetical protein